VLGPLEGGDKKQPGYIKRMPDVKLQDFGDGKVVTVHGSRFKLDNGNDIGIVTGNYMEKHVAITRADDASAEGQSFLRHGP
jgi:hypothetical protein